MFTQKRSIFSLVFAFSLFFAFQVFSQEFAANDFLNMSLEELLNVEISVASKSEESVNDAPGIISVITKQEIEGFAAQNLGEILNRVVGVAFLSPDVFVDQSVVFRGQEVTPYNNHTLILLNGRPVRDPITGGMNGSIWTAFPVDIIERIEIIRGPGSVLYGSCAYSGVVNIVTTIPDGEGMKGKTGVGVGSYNSFSQYYATSIKQDDLEIQVAGGHLKDDGPKYSFIDYEGVDSNDYFHRETASAFLNVSYKEFSLNALYADFQPYSLNGSEYWDPGYKNLHTTYFVDAGYSKKIGKFTVNPNFTYNMHYWIGGGGDDNYGKSSLFELNITSQPIENLNVIVGGGYEANSWDAEIVYDGDLSSSFLYSQIDYRLIEQLKLIGGIQYNKIEGIDGNVSPRAGIVANLTKSFGAKLLYSEAFRQAYRNETSFAVVVFRGNPDLEPELIRTVEAQLFYNTSKMQSSLTYYNSRMSQIITRKYFSDPTIEPPLPPFYLKYLNGGEWDFWGIEFEEKYTVTPELLLTGSFYYQDNEKKKEDEEDPEDKTLHPEIMVKLGLLYTKPKFTIGVFNSYFGEPGKTTDAKPGSAVVNKEPEANNLLSVKATYKAFQFKGGQTIILSAEGENLLDKDILYPDYPNKNVNSLMPLRGGATFMGKVSVEF